MADGSEVKYLVKNESLLRYAGLFTWAAVGLWLVIFFLDPESLPLYELEGAPFARIMRWVVVYLAFGLIYWGVTRDLNGARLRLLDHLSLLVMTACAIGVSFFSGTALGSILLMVLAGLFPWLLPVRMAVFWLVLGNLAVVPVYANLMGFPWVVAILQAMGYLGFSSFVFVTALIAKRQVQAREEQRRLNAELRATRALLAESARVNERTRISRELHDLLGHHLTALSLNLEVAVHLTEGQAQEHVRQAHTLAKLLLTDVREAVSQLREGGAIDLAAALRPLVTQVPSLDIQLEIQPALIIDDPERAHVLLRCVQEIVTNTVRHARAGHLWIDLRREQDEVVVEARDDGHGADAYVAGNGLRGMRERLAQYGGTLDIETRRGAGFALRLAIPGSVAPLAAAVPKGVM
ncbi:MAG TPA: sensor histidine kinase [Stenotrophomonas sp.]|jgi:signal transduction histidine kinase